MFRNMFCCLVIHLLVATVPVQADARQLCGLVSILGEQDQQTPASNVTVRIEETGNSDVTTVSGAFCCALLDYFNAGEKVTLQTEYEGYQILYPLAGQVRIPADLQKERVKVQLDVLGSHRFLSNRAFALLVEQIANEAKEQVGPEQETQEIDLNRYLKAWATRHGFGLTEVQTELDKWAKEVEANYENFYELGLAAFYNKHFGEAAENFTRSAAHHAERLAGLREQEEDVKEKLIRDYLLAGDAYFSDYRFEEARVAYQSAMEEIDEDTEPQKWASVLVDLSNTYWRLGRRVEGDVALDYLTRAISGYRSGLDAYPRDIFPQQWADIQNDLGNALQVKGIRTAGDTGTALLAEAVMAYQHALTVRTRDTLPQDWAMTKNNLGVALEKQGIRTAGDAGTALLAEAVIAYRDALTVRTRDTLPQDWATTQSNLGLVLQEQGIRTSGVAGAALLAEAVMAYQHALTVRTRDTLPQPWADTQNNLGIARALQGIRTGGMSGLQFLTEAVTAYRNALTVRTRDTLPQPWADTQNNLGIALQAQALLTSNEDDRQDLLQKAVESFHRALEVRTYKHLSHYWAQTQYNLARAYIALQDWSKAADCFMNFLKVYPNRETVHRLASGIYHEYLFDFERAYVLNAKWVKELGHDDISSRSDFLETHITTGRFVEAITLLSELLSEAASDPQHAILLRAFEIVLLFAQSTPDTVPIKFDELIAILQKQPDDFTLGWSFNGIKHFLNESEEFAPYREWLLALFTALEGKQRDVILDRLQSLRETL